MWKLHMGSGEEQTRVDTLGFLSEKCEQVRKAKGKEKLLY